MLHEPVDGDTPRHEVALTFTPAELLEALRRAGYAFPPAAQVRAVVELREQDLVAVVVRAADYGRVAPGTEAPRYPARQVRAGDVTVAVDAAARAGGLFVHSGEPLERAADRAKARIDGPAGTPAPLPGEGLERRAREARPGHITFGPELRAAYDAEVIAEARAGIPAPVLPDACVAGTCGCPSAPDGADQHELLGSPSTLAGS